MCSRVRRPHTVLQVPFMRGPSSSLVVPTVHMYGVVLLLVFFFFFQAEDGIRDVAVTGVQTCALPISLVLLYVSRSPSPVAAPPDAELTSATLDQLLTYPVPVHLNAALVAQRDSALRSEEHTSELQSRLHLVCRLLLEKKKKKRVKHAR